MLNISTDLKPFIQYSKIYPEMWLVTLLLFAGVNLSLLSRVMSSRLSRGTYNGGLLSTEAGTLARVVADATITLAGFLGESKLLNITLLPSLVICFASIVATCCTYNTLYWESMCVEKEKKKRRRKKLCQCLFFIIPSLNGDPLSKVLAFSIIYLCNYPTIYSKMVCHSWLDLMWVFFIYFLLYLFIVSLFELVSLVCISFVYKHIYMLSIHLVLEQMNPAVFYLFILWRR